MLTRFPAGANASKVPVGSPLAGVERRMELLCTRPGDTRKAALSDASLHHLRAGGSRVRARMACAVAARLGLAVDDGIAIATGCELLHNASLVHDDLQDGDRRRRGQPAVWDAFGANTAICVGDLMISAAFAALADISLPERLPQLLRHTHAAVSRTIAGQVDDLTASRPQFLTPDDYEAIAAAKSGPLLALPLELPLIVANADDAMTTAARATRHFAIGYQIIDDLEDWTPDRQAEPRSGANSLNLLAILSAAHPQHGEQTLRRSAAARAHDHLNRALALAAELPAGTGTPLAGHTQPLFRRLERHA